MILSTPLAVTAIVILSIQMIILVAGSATRYSKFKEIGLYNKLLAWPQSYKLKLGIQVFNLVLVIAQIVLLFVLSQITMYREVSLFLQVVVWVVSICISRFEFRRAIGHIWYMHPLLWWYTTLYYVFILSSDALSKNVSGNFNERLPLFILLLCQVCSTLILAVLSSVYPRDISLKRLNYVQFELEDDNINTRLLPDSTFV
jgi:hypothetical protein